VTLDIIKYGHPVLREKGTRINQITPDLRELAADMIETMHVANGLGLAAQQVGRALMLAVIDVLGSDRPSQLLIDGQPQDLAMFMPLVLVNPELTNFQGELASSEGCLSIPEVNAEIPRAATITVRAQSPDGGKLAFDCTGLLACVAQHEVDHLNGILFVDRMDAATRASFAGKLKKLQKETTSQLGKIARPRRALARL